MLKEHEYLLICLAEEASEIQKACTKALRFGFHERPPIKTGETPRKETNAEQIALEVADLVAVVEKLENLNAIPVYTAQQVADKHKKIDRYMDYARSGGTLEPKNET